MKNKQHPLIKFSIPVLILILGITLSIHPGQTAAGIEIRDLNIELEGDLDLHTFLGLNPQGNAGYDNISVKVSIDSDASAEDLQALHEKVVGTSPVGHTLARAVPVSIDLT